MRKHVLGILCASFFSQQLMAQTTPEFLKTQSLSDAITKIIKVNESAKNHMEWHVSGTTPEDLFRYIRSGQRESFKGDLCGALNQLKLDDLTLFEEEIKRVDNKELLANCSSALSTRLNAYWFKEKFKMRQAFSRGDETAEGFAPMDPNGDVPLNFQFQTEVQTRDVSRGYYVISGDLKPKQVVLTFDDGPNPETTPVILNTLAVVNAKVLFFHLGKNVLANPDIVRRESEEGHMIGSHTFDHYCLPNTRLCKKSNGFRLNTSQAIDQIKRAHKAIYDVLGWVAPFFRFPYGESAPELKQFLRDHQTAEFFWSVDSNDWRKQTPTSVLERTLAEIESNNGGVVLFHDIQRRTAEMLPLFLKELYYRNYTLVVLKPQDESQFTRPILLQ